MSDPTHNPKIDPDWRKRTVTLTAGRDAPPIDKGMRLAVVMDGKREIYEVDEVKPGPIGWDLNVTLVKTQFPTGITYEDDPA